MRNAGGGRLPGLWRGQSAQPQILRTRAVLANTACVGDAPDVAEGLLLEALEACASLGMRPAAARCHLSLGTLYRRVGPESQAREHLGAAAKMFGEMHMRFWLERTEAETRELPRMRGA